MGDSLNKNGNKSKNDGVSLNKMGENRHGGSRKKMEANKISI
jgi:hypothetical protein